MHLCMIYMFYKYINIAAHHYFNLSLKGALFKEIKVIMQV
jgi:hypothetical protein